MSNDHSQLSRHSGQKKKFDFQLLLKVESMAYTNFEWSEIAALFYNHHHHYHHNHHYLPLYLSSNLKKGQ